MHTKRPARLKHLPYLGLQRYSLTFCTDWKRKWFENADAVALVLSQFLRVSDSEGFAVLAYCFMPDREHLLIEGLRDDSDARKFIIKSKQCSAHAYAQTFGARLWQPFGYEHVLRDDEKVQVVARYILENPVRAGLVKTVLDYSFAGSQVYDVEELVATLPERD
jgi:REP element-mobilizing transposase RayT